MPTATSEDWGVIARRMAKVPAAIDSWMKSLHSAADKGNVAPRRQVEACMKQCVDLTADDGYFAGLLAGAKAGDADLTDAVRSDLEKSVAAAADAYRALGDRPRRDPRPRPEADACGRERYQLLSRAFLGATVDLEETYRWGQEELARITAEMEAVAEQIKPGATVKEAIAALDADPAYQLHGTDELKAWMQTKADEAIAKLAGTHFDIPDPVRTIECLIAPTQTGGIYYTGPARTSRARAACGGPCRRASPSSAPGAS